VINQARYVVEIKAYLNGINIVASTDALSTLCEALLPTISEGVSGNDSFYPMWFNTTDSLT